MTATLLDRPLPASDPADAPRQAAALARLGRYAVDLAVSPAEREAVFALRYRVFVEEGGARPPGADPLRRRECEDFDTGADHIIVRARFGHARPVLGTCRVRMVEGANPHPGGASELFDLAPLFAAHPLKRFCEVGRSCVAPAMRGGHVLDALWCGLFAYATARRLDALFGSASFPGANPKDHAGVIGPLLAHRTGQGPGAVSPHPHRAARLTGARARPLQAREERALPALLRGYLHMGAILGTDAACDPAFDTTDLFVLAPLATIPLAYRRHFARATGQAL